MSLDIAIFTDEPGWHGKVLGESLRRAGARARILSPMDCLMHVEGRRSRLAWPEQRRQPDGVFVRGVAAGSLEQIIFRLNVLHGLEGQGVAVCNPPKVIERTVDKPLTSLLLAQAGVPTPRTWICESAEQARETLRAETRDGARLVQKPLFGSQGQGLHLLGAGDDLAHDEKFAGVYYLQSFVEREQWVDYRVLVAQGEAIAAMRRQGSSWKTNRAQGAVCQAAALEPELKRLAEDAVALLDMDYGGVDLIPDSQGNLQVLEVNSLPAWYGLQQQCGFSISDRLARMMIDKIHVRSAVDADR